MCVIATSRPGSSPRRCQGRAYRVGVKEIAVLAFRLVGVFDNWLARVSRSESFRSFDGGMLNLPSFSDIQRSFALR